MMLGRRQNAVCLMYSAMACPNRHLFACQKMAPKAFLAMLGLYFRWVRSTLRSSSYSSRSPKYASGTVTALINGFTKGGIIWQFPFRVGPMAMKKVSSMHSVHWLVKYCSRLFRNFRLRRAFRPPLTARRMRTRTARGQHPDKGVRVDSRTVANAGRMEAALVAAGGTRIWGPHVRARGTAPHAVRTCGSLRPWLKTC